MSTDKELGDYPVDVAVETTSNIWYTFSYMDYVAFSSALKRAVADNTTFSMFNLDGVAIVFSWRVVRTVHVACMGENYSAMGDDEELIDQVWTLAWERTSPATIAPARVFNES